MRITEEDAHCAAHLCFRDGDDARRAAADDVERLRVGHPHGEPAGHRVGGIRTDRGAGGKGQRISRGIRGDDPDDFAAKPQRVARRDHPRDAAAEPDRDIDHIEVGNRAEQLEPIAGDAAHQQRMVGRDKMQLFLLGELARMLEGRLKIVPGLDQPCAKPLHRAVLLDAVAVRCHDRRCDPQPRRGECYALPVIAGGRGHHPAQVRLRAAQRVEIDEPAADLEGADRRVVLVLDPQLGADPPRQ